jgi:asparagine synthase (glutamine-hydrolysing)
MCGIAGYARLGNEQGVDPSHLPRMLDLLHHRGPDDHGSCVFPGLAMGNTRLSIIDIEGGHQPISNENDDVIIVYNGECYNAPELREELIAKGHRFKTHTDTEVLVHLYEEEGPDFLKRLNGMFALSIYDRRDGSLLLARDRFGVKPLFWFARDGLVAWASELKALKHLPEFDTRLSPQGLSTFLGLMYIPDPWTIYANVAKLRPGHYVRVDRDGAAVRQYFDLNFSNKSAIGRREAEDQMAVHLRRAVQRQMLSDVPVGVLLSGGLDSRSMLAAASELTPGLPSFTITFNEQLFDEGGEADYWAKAFGSAHQKLLVNEEDFCGRVLRRQKHQDEPYGPWCQVAVEALAQKIHESDIKVVLSGEGGDEIFLGYPTIHAANVARFYRLLPEFVRRKLIRPVVKALPAGQGRLPLAFVAQSFVESDHPDLVRTFFGFKEVLRYADWPQLLTPEALAQIGDIDPAIAFYQYRDQIAGLHLVDGLSYLDAKVFLPGCSFVGNDNAYMAHSVEARVPMTDNDLVDFATSLPVSTRFHPMRLKVVPRAALPRHFPPPHGEGKRRYKKAGFEVPTQPWLNGGGFGRFLSRILSPERVARTGFFRPAAVQQILDEQLTGRRNNERVLQVLMSLVLFLDQAYDSI